MTDDNDYLNDYSISELTDLIKRIRYKYKSIDHLIFLEQLLREKIIDSLLDE